jgi:hypothetical protein
MADTNEILGMSTALAGGAVATALLQALFDKDILTLDEARGVLQSAIRSLAPVMQTPAGFRASQVIGDLQRGKFSARG